MQLNKSIPSDLVMHRQVNDSKFKGKRFSNANTQTTEEKDKVEYTCISVIASHRRTTGILNVITSTTLLHYSM